MANQGTYDNRTLMTTDQWKKSHAGIDTQRESMFGNRTSFTDGGIQTFGKLEEPISTFEHAQNLNLEGFYGSVGEGGGSAILWNPELKIGFAYVTTDLM